MPASVNNPCPPHHTGSTSLFVTGKEGKRQERKKNLMHEFNRIQGGKEKKE
jgi:hypothetical protein